MKVSSQAVYKLTMLWAFAESGVGGLLHGFRLPVTGLVLGAFSVVIISLLAHVSLKPGRDILQATIVVLAIKFTVSPHSPLPAYVAVLFQGLVGAGIFSLLGRTQFSVLLFALLALVESAIQKPVVATLIFGTELWTAMNEWINNIISITGSSMNVHFSKWLLTAYVGVHVCWAILVGFWAYRLPHKLQALTVTLNTNSSTDESKDYKKSKNTKSKFSAIIILLLLGLLVLYTMPVEGRWLFTLRAFLVVLILYVLVTPLLRVVIKRIAGQQPGAIRDYWNMLPALKQNMQIAKANANTEKGFLKRISKFVTVSIWLTLYRNGTPT